jgi:hypothetical protein
LEIDEGLMVTEVGAMAYRWPEDTDFALWELEELFP